MTRRHFLDQSHSAAICPLSKDSRASVHNMWESVCVPPCECKCVCVHVHAFFRDYGMHQWRWRHGGITYFSALMKCSSVVSLPFFIDCHLLTGSLTWKLSFSCFLFVFLFFPLNCTLCLFSPVYKECIHLSQRASPADVYYAPQTDSTTWKICRVSFRSVK